MATRTFAAWRTRPGSSVSLAAYRLPADEGASPELRTSEARAAATDASSDETVLTAIPDKTRTSRLGYQSRPKLYSAGLLAVVLVLRGGMEQRGRWEPAGGGTPNRDWRKE